MAEKKNEEKNLLASYYGSKAFLKIKQCLEIGKIQFSFVEKENSKNHIDCYMEAEEFGAILMNGIKNNSLIKTLMAEKAKGEQYPKAIWTSPVGGNATGNNGTPISRYFEISPGNASEVLFTALSFPAEKNTTGAFIKKKGSKPLVTLRIPCSFNDLKILAYKWNFLEADYMHKKYSYENMKSAYSPKCTDTYSSSEAPDYSDPSAEEQEIPYVSSESSDNKTKAASAENTLITLKLIAISVLEKVPDKNIKVCRVTDNGTEHRLICLLDKISDNKRLNDFETQLNARINSNKTLEFKAEVAIKGSDYYFCKFA